MLVLNISMDKDIKELRKRAGLDEQQTYTLAHQESVDEIIKAESEFLFKIASHLKFMKQGMGPNVFNPQRTMQDINKALQAIAIQLENLDKLKNKGQ